MNRLQLVKRIREHLAESGQGQYSDLTLQTQVSVSARSLAGELGLIQSYGTVGSLSGALTLPAGTVNVIRAFLPGSGAELQICPASTLLALDRRALDGTLSGTPNTLIVDESLLGPGVAKLYPAGVDGTLITVYAYVDGGDLANDTDVPWGGRYDAYHDVIAYHAAHHLITRQGKAAAGDPVWLNRFHDRLEALRDRGSAGSLATQARISVPIRANRMNRRYGR